MCYIPIPLLPSYLSKSLQMPLPSFLFPSFLFLLFLPSSVSSLCTQHDYTALMQFKNSFLLNYTLPYYSSYGCSYFPSKTESWKNGTDCCQWDGVTCNTMSGHVIALHLSCSHLQGHLHPNSTIFKLTHLQYLNLAFNDFLWSSLGPKIGDLVNLTHLNLRHSSISGNIPSTLSHLSNLVSLDLSSNAMTLDGFEFISLMLDSSTWNKLITNATKLREVALDQVDMSAIRESSLSLLMNFSSTLVSLSLPSTGLQGNFPSDILCLPNLQTLDLSDNKMLRVELPKYNRTTPLRYLDLFDTSVSGQIPNSIGQLKSLNFLALGDCFLNGSIPLSMWNLTQLTHLDLRANNLKGKIPSLISNLRHLIYINLSMNKFGGLIPSSLFHLPQLSYLYLSENNLIGPIPSKITKHSKLRILILSNNMLNGTIPHRCFSLPSLSTLFLQDNQLTGSIGTFSSYSLTDMDLSNNKLEGNFPNSIFELQNLHSLSLSSNNFSGFVDFHRFSSLKNLFSLDLSKNNFFCINLNSIDDYILPNLEKLSLSWCNINVFPKFLAQLKYLEDLDLSNNKIQGQIPKWFHQKLLNIIYIDLSFNQFQGDLPIPSRGTEYFSVSYNNFSGDISSTICNASSLSVLNLAHNNLKGIIPQCLGTFPSLSVLDLQMNNLHGNMPTNFSKGNFLETIKLNNNRLEGPLPKSLVQCTLLEVLDLADNNLEDSFPAWLETLPELKVLSLRSNRFHGVITCSKYSEHPFPNLKIFDVSNNNFSGPLPASYIRNFDGMMNVNDSQIGLEYMANNVSYSYSYNESVVVVMKGQYMDLVRILTTFTTIDLSNNMFEGEIPQVIGELNSLRGLNLSHNRINGTIPQHLSDLRDLEWLDLSSNRLTGQIPMALTKLNFLSILNLSQNQLEGLIPTGNQFNTFENGSYEGNPMLCGVPLSKACKKVEELSPHATVDQEESGFGWKPVAVGYASGMVFGMVLGYNVFFHGKPQWLTRVVEVGLRVRLKRTNT